MGYEGKLFGAYRATRLIMRDDFVDVYEGEHTKLHTKVAIRVADTSPSASYVKDFVAGAHVLARLSHPNITRLLELGESNRVPFIILQPIKATLQDRYAKGTKLPLSSIIAYTRQLAEALQHAHNQGIVHREVKPTSIFMGLQDEILLGDWDSAVDMNKGGISNNVVGTPLYMAPEQFIGEVRPTIDQYALGVVVYEWLSGKVPSAGKSSSINSSFMQVALQKTFDSPPSLRAENPSVPQGVEDVVLKALAKNPRDRFESVMAFAAALEKAHRQTTIAPSITALKPVQPEPMQNTSIGKQYGNYRLISVIGGGHLGIVYLGEHIRSHEKAAIKLFHSWNTEEIFKYIHMIANLKHPNIVPILETGIQDALPYFVMEYLPNGTLRQRHPQGTIVSLPTVVSYVKQLASALQYAHNNSILHENIKPKEIFVTSTNTISLNGFDNIVEKLETRDLATPFDYFTYKFPEQLQADILETSASDLYLLAVIVYEWLTGSLPFKGDMGQLITQHVHTPPPPLRSKVPSIPQAVEDVVLKALAKNPKDRFESVMAFAEALERASQPPKPKFHPKDLLGQQFGNYRLVTLLGIGSFADVYVAEHIALSTKAAIKVFREQMDVDQFRSAVRRLARLQHPNIVRVLDSGIQNERAFLVLDYVANGSLYQHHTQTGQSRLALPIVLHYVKQLATGLQEIHDYNIVPTVISPADMLLGDNAEVLFDSINTLFISQEHNPPISKYMAPEQLRATLLPASNQYVLAFVAYEWLSGRQMTKSEALANTPLAPLHTLVPDIPQEVSDVIMKALARDPKDRYPTIEDFANALEDASQPKESTKTRVGQQFGKYRLMKLLGRGGFADVYQGRHSEMNTFAAIKVLHTLMHDQDGQRFLAEARTIASLRHPNIIRVLDFGIEDETPYLVMDQANGTLRDRHPNGSVLPARTILPYIKQVAAALQYAHDQRRIHRDIKPENMLIGVRNDILLSDFGLATTLNTATYQQTKSIAGTATYTAPEQFRGRAGFASDQYALAIVIYEWLCGSPPFTEGDFMQLGFQHGYEPVPPLREKVPSLSPDVERVVMIALAKDPKQRFASIQAFANAFEQACL